MGPGGMGNSQGWGWEPSLPGSPTFPTLGCRKSLGGAHLGCRSGLCHFCPFSLPRVHVGPRTLTSFLKVSHWRGSCLSTYKAVAELGKHGALA